MTQFIAMDPNVEVSGETVLSMVAAAGMFKDNALKILAENGIRNPQPRSWYPQQAWLNAFKAVAETVGPNTLFQIGMHTPVTAVLPQGIESLQMALSAIDVAYHMNHRGGEIGNYKFVQTSDRTGKMVCINPYPCDYDRGIITAMCRRFAPAGSFVRVKHDDEAQCRKKGAESCTYLIWW